MPWTSKHAPARRRDRLGVLGRAAGQRADVDLLEGDGVARVLQPAEGEQVADEPVEVRGLGLGAVEVARVADAALERLERAAQREQRRAQVVGDRRDHEAALMLGGGRGAQRVAQPACHAVQRVADLRDLAGAGGQRLDVELAARDPLRVGGQPRQRLQHPAPQEHDDDDERGAERGEAGAERDGPARGRALARHPQQPADRRRGDRDLAVALEPRLGVALRERRGQQLRLVGQGQLGRHGVGDLGLGDVGDLGLGGRRAELGLDAERRQTAQDRVAVGGGVQLGGAQHRDRLVATVGLAPGLPPAGRRPGGQARERGDRHREGEREPEPDVQRERAAHQAAGGSKR